MEKQLINTYLVPLKVKDNDEIMDIESEKKYLVDMIADGVKSGTFTTYPNEPNSIPDFAIILKTERYFRFTGGITQQILFFNFGKLDSPERMDFRKNIIRQLLDVDITSSTFFNCGPIASMELGHQFLFMVIEAIMTMDIKDEDFAYHEDLRVRDQNQLGFCSFGLYNLQGAGEALKEFDTERQKTKKITLP